MSQKLEMELPDEVLLAMQKDASELAGEMRLAAAVKWYEIGMVSQEKAAEVAGVSRARFIDELARFHVSPFQEEVGEILDAAKNVGP